MFVLNIKIPHAHCYKLFTLSRIFFNNIIIYKPYIHLYGERKDNGSMVSISKYPQ